MAFTARSLDTIFQQLLTYKQTIPELTELTTSVNDIQTLLDELQSDSKTARWVLETYVSAYNTWVLEQLMQDREVELQNIKDTAEAGTKGWYVTQATKFQYGDTVIVDESTGYVPSYTVIDTGKQIVEFASADEISDKLLLKIRGRDSDVLTEDEQNSFASYIKDIKFVNTKVAIQNIESDKLKLYGTIKYNGNKELSTVTSEVEAAINNYLLNIEFDSSLIKNKLVDAVQAVDGVFDFEIDTLEGRANSSELFVSITHRYKSLAGYMRIDTNFELSTTISYEIEK